MEPHIVFFIDEKDEVRFRGILKKYWQYLKQKTQTEADDLSKISYNNLVRGLDLEGNPKDDSNLQHFDELLSSLTKNYYVPNQAQRFRWKRGNKPKAKPYLTKKSNGKKTEPSGSGDKAANRIKANLLSEYPFLDRRDLEESIENYCKLIVKINELMAGDIVINNVAIKNLTETMIKLGTFLGINEAKKAEQKAMEDKQSIASLSSQFQLTIDKYPAIIDRMKYQEIRILLEKYDSQSIGISRELFESPAYAAMSIEKAREFIQEREAKYESR